MSDFSQFHLFTLLKSPFKSFLSESRRIVVRKGETAMSSSMALNIMSRTILLPLYYNIGLINPGIHAHRQQN